MSPTSILQQNKFNTLLNGVQNSGGMGGGSPEKIRSEKLNKATTTSQERIKRKS